MEEKNKKNLPLIGILISATLIIGILIKLALEDTPTTTKLSQFNKQLQEQIGKVNKLFIHSSLGLNECSSYDLVPDKSIQLTAAHCNPVNADEYSNPIVRLVRPDVTEDIKFNFIVLDQDFNEYQDFEILYEDVKRDVLIIGQRGTRPKKKIHLDRPKPNKNIVSVGFAGHNIGKKLTVSQGRILINLLSEIPNSLGLLTGTMSNALVYAGMSGGPLFNTDGDLIGVNSSSRAKEVNTAPSGVLQEGDALMSSFATFNAIRMGVDKLNKDFGFNE